GLRDPRRFPPPSDARLTQRRTQIRTSTHLTGTELHETGIRSIGADLERADTDSTSRREPTSSVSTVNADRRFQPPRSIRSIGPGSISDFPSFSLSQGQNKRPDTDCDRTRIAHSHVGLSDGQHPASYVIDESI